jgi:acetyltransferase-like isoleucine patch superfamily enzyme
MSSSFYTKSELNQIGFNKIGKNCLISRKASIYSPESINLGDNVRIDDFCILSGSLNIGSFIHISAFTSFFARYHVEIENFVTISARVLVYTQNDDYSGKFMTNPMVPVELTNVSGGQVKFQKHSIVGAGCVILPGIVLNEGACLGAMSLAKTDLAAWSIYAGIPCKFIKTRNREVLELEKLLY